MARESCFDCVYAYYDVAQVVASFNCVFPVRPTCANHPDSLGRRQPTPFGGICRNFRRKPADPAQGAKQIPLADGPYAYVDAADYEWLSRYNWRLQNGYAARRDKTRVVYMHRELMKPPRGMTVNHANRNRLDNTRENLRVCTRQQNTHNNGKHMGSSSRFKGVGYNREKEKWFAKAYIEGERIWLGYHDEEEAAARAYDAKAVELFGEFAHLNFPEDWPPERRKEVHAMRHAEDAECKSRKCKTHNARRKTNQPRVETRGRREQGRVAKRCRGRADS